VKRNIVTEKVEDPAAGDIPKKKNRKKKKNKDETFRKNQLGIASKQGLSRRTRWRGLCQARSSCWENSFSISSNCVCKTIILFTQYVHISFCCLTFLVLSKVR
jgi:hypothetical protein